MFPLWKCHSRAPRRSEVRSEHLRDGFEKPAVSNLRHTEHKHQVDRITIFWLSRITYEGTKKSMHMINEKLHWPNHARDCKDIFSKSGCSSPQMASHPPQNQSIHGVVCSSFANIFYFPWLYLLELHPKLSATANPTLNSEEFNDSKGWSLAAAGTPHSLVKLLSHLLQVPTNAALLISYLPTYFIRCTLSHPYFYCWCIPEIPCEAPYVLFDVFLSCLQQNAKHTKTEICLLNMLSAI